MICYFFTEISQYGVRNERHMRHFFMVLFNKLKMLY